MLTALRPTSRNPHREPRILVAGRRAWAECRCGWTGPTCRTPAQASASWAAHVARETSGGEGER